MSKNEDALDPLLRQLHAIELELADVAGRVDRLSAELLSQWQHCRQLGERLGELHEQVARRRRH